MWLYLFILWAGVCYASLAGPFDFDPLSFSTQDLGTSTLVSNPYVNETYLTYTPTSLPRGRIFTIFNRTGATITAQINDYWAYQVGHANKSVAFYLDDYMTQLGLLNWNVDVLGSAAIMLEQDFDSVVGQINMLSGSIYAIAAGLDQNSLDLQAPFYTAAPSTLPNGIVLVADPATLSLVNGTIAMLPTNNAGTYISPDVTLDTYGRVVVITNGSRTIAAANVQFNGVSLAAFLNASLLALAPTPFPNAAVLAGTTNEISVSGPVIALAPFGTDGTYVFPTSLTVVKGRIQAATNGTGTISAANILFNGTSLANILFTSFVTTGPSALPFASPLSGTASEISVSGSTIGLAPFGTDGTYTFPSLLTIVKGRVQSITNGTASQAATVVNGISANVTVAAGTNIAVTTSVPGKNIVVATVASPSFTSETLTAGSNQMTINGVTINVAAGSQTINFASLGNADVVQTAGAQTLAGDKSFSSAPVALGGVGVKLNNAANTFTTTVQPAALTQNTQITLPPDNGVLGYALVTDGSGGTSWTFPGGVERRLYTMTAGLSSSPAAGAWVTAFSGTGVGSRTIPANTMIVGSSLRFSVRGIFSTVLSAGVSARLTIGGVAAATASLSGLSLLSSVPFSVTGECAVRTAGASGTMVCGITGLFNGGILQTATTTTIAVDTTSAVTVDTQLQFSLLGNSFTSFFGKVNIMT